MSIACVAMGSTGLSAVIGSWNTMAMRSPRSRRSSLGPRVQNVPAVEQDLPAADLGIVREQPHDRRDQRGLAAAALADQADDLAARHHEIDVAQRVDPPARREEIDRQVADLEQRCPCRLSPAAAGDRTRRAASRPGT